MLDSIRYAIQTSKVCSLLKKGKHEFVGPEEAFYFATLGGAKALHMEDTIGNFVVGKEFDALVIDVAAPDSPIDCFPEILWIKSSTDLEEEMTEQQVTSDANIHYMKQSQFMMPGLIDTHIHPGQTYNNGIGLEVCLFDWIATYTIPLYQKLLTDLSLARSTFEKAVNRLLKNGTTTAAYQLYTDKLAELFADIVNDRGQRALIGLASKTKSYNLEKAEEEIIETEDGLKLTENFIKYIYDLQTPLIKPVITPLTVDRCSSDLLKGLGKMAGKYNCHIQVHVAETETETNLYKDFHPECTSSAEALDRAGLLTEKTFLAHCIWLTEEEISLLRRRKVAVAHCPNSNISLRSGLCDARQLFSRGIKLGLGTDCSAGYSPSMLDSIRHGIQTSKVCSFLKKGNHEFFGPEEAFYFATLGGAKALHMEDTIGNFVVGKEFDALVIDVAAPDSPIDCFPEETIWKKVNKFLFNGDDRNILSVYVAGKRVNHRHSP